MKFSIICLTYKRISLLEESVFSVLQQTHQDFELLIINDYSPQIIHFEHPKVKIFNLDKKIDTLGEKRNFGRSKATGDWIIQLDDDDLFLPTYLENLNNLINKSSGIDLLSPQRPIFYYSPDKIYLSPRQMTNVFLYKKETVASKFNYDHINFDELTPFYLRVKNHNPFSKMSCQLPPDKCGYVYRQENLENRKYSMANFKTESLEDQNTILNSISDDAEGNITLVPKWSIDYTDIIKSKLTIIPLKTSDTTKKIMDEATKEANSWNSVKPSWANALKFVEAIKSRGLLSTVLDVTGIDKTNGERVTDDVLKTRMLSCFGDKNSGIEPCYRLKHTENKGYFCGGCGCGQNALARLDSDTPDGYTKLHYPYLECPLEKPGFSNENSGILSIIITALNEDLTILNNTIKSIRDTSNGVEIIVIDDCSTIPVVVEDKSVKIFRNSSRTGCAPSRQIGATKASNKYLLFTDSHMIYVSGWYESFLSHAKNEKENVAFCGVCLGLSSERRTLKDHAGKYNGARLSFYEAKENQVLEGKWIDEKPGDVYELSCMMGAIYFINKEYFFKLRGFTDLKMWGSDEPCLSLKILLSGGKILLIKGIQAGHIFRNVAPYSTGIDFLIYNKIRVLKTLLPDDIADRLINKLPKDGNFISAMNMIEKESDVIKEYKEYYKSIFTSNIESICEKFNIPL